MTVDNIITAEFQSGYHSIDSQCSLWQYDYGQILRLKGFDLPLATEVHFSTVPTGGEAETRIGTTIDGVTEVHIPGELLKLPKTQDYSIYAYVYVTDAESGNTEYKIRIPVRSRPKPIPDKGTEEEKSQLAEAVNAVNAAADRAEGAKDAAVKSAEAAETAQRLAEDAAGEAVKAKKSIDATMVEFSEDASQVLAGASEARDLAEAWAHGSEAHPELDKDNAKFYAELAKQSATTSGFCRLHVDGGGHLILERTANIVDSLDFRLTENGHLEVEMR